MKPLNKFNSSSYTDKHRSFYSTSNFHKSASFSHKNRDKYFYFIILLRTKYNAVLHYMSLSILITKANLIQEIIPVTSRTNPPCSLPLTNLINSNTTNGTSKHSTG